ncbi:MAG: DUF11 domain-containing protein [Caldilinea sp. CFX5]|nr:DUF11 domain-containing protein [Caldilinea sp. CFX5]
MALGFGQRLTRIAAILGRGLGTQRIGRRFSLWLLVLVMAILGEQSWRLSATPALTATKSAALLVDQNNNGLADPGDQLRYTIAITNSGNEDLTGLQFSDTIPAATHLVTASLRTTPLAHNDDGYSTVGNVLLSVPVSQGVLLNDRDLDGAGGLAVVSYRATSSNGGAVTMAPDGSFTYNPAPGYTGIDSFRYGIADGEGNRITATVTITVGQMVWFINNAAPVPGDGRFTAPFNSISAFMTQAADKAGDLIFIDQGVGAYGGTLILLNQQQVFGHGNGLTVAPNLAITAAARPTLANVVLASGNTVRGLNINAGSGIGLQGNNVGGLTVNNVAVTGNGAPAVQLSGGSSAMTVTLDSVIATGGVHGINLTNNRGRVTVNGGTIQNTSGHAIKLLNNTGPLDFTLRNSTISNAAAGQNGLHLELPSSGSFGVVTVQNNTFRNNGSTGVRASVGGMGSIGKIAISNNTFTGNASGVDLATNAQGGIIFDIRDNATMSGDQTQINIAANDPNHNDGIGPTMTGIIRNNRLTLNPDGGAIGIWIVADGDGKITVDVANNRVNDFGESGIAVESLGGAGQVHARIVSNTVTTTASSSLAALYLRSGDGSSGESNLLCVNLSSNKMTAGAGAEGDYLLEQTALATPFQIQGLSPAVATATETAAFVAATDGAPPATAVATGSFVRATCETVTLAARPGTAPLLAHAPVNGWLTGRAAPPPIRRAPWWPLSLRTWRSARAPALLNLFRPATAQAAGETVALAIGTMHAGQTLVITFAVTIDPAFTGTEVCNQGAVSMGAGSPVLTDEPTVAGSADPTCFAVVPPDTTPPETTITSAPPNPSKSQDAHFTFTGSDNVTPVENLTFECALDNSNFAPCTTPYESTGLANGLHTFRVRAVDSVGNRDPSPATFIWNINPIVTRPNLTAIKSNDSGSALPEQPWRWQITINNFGDGAATFVDGATLLLDNLPDTLLTYGEPTLVNTTNVTGAEQIRCTIAVADLTCRAEGGTVTIGALTGAITVAFSARTAVPGDYGNPRPGGRCLADPDNHIDEASETNNDCADTVKVGLPDMTIEKRHSGDFIRGQAGAEYLITVRNVGAIRSAGVVQVDETLPAGLTATAMSGAGWLCALSPLHCTRSDPLAAGAAYPPITLIVVVADDAPGDLLNQVTVTGGSDASPDNNSATDKVQLIVPEHDLYLPVIQRQ